MQIKMMSHAENHKLASHKSLNFVLALFSKKQPRWEIDGKSEIFFPSWLAVAHMHCFFLIF